MKKSILVVGQLEKYFGAKIIGSYLFVEADLLKEEDVNDIDIIADHSSASVNRMKVYLTDAGFTAEDVKTRDSIYSAEILVRTKWSNSEYDKVIDMNYFKALPTVYTIPELVQAKFKSGRADDLKQLAMVIFNRGGNGLKSIKDLQEFYEQNKSTEDETTG